MSHPISLKDLNPAQKEAVIWGANPLLILAGAGSGKTRILTYRIAYLISQGIPAFQILGVTFTNKAAQEMKSRVLRLIDRDVWVSTFHSTCLRILRMDGPQIGIDRNFTIYDDHDQLVLIKECMKEMNFNDKQIHPKGIRERIQRAKDSLITPYQYLEKAEDFYEENVGRLYEKYEEKLLKLKACDFGDLIVKTVHLFDRVPKVLETWQERFQHILIDEYQDTNHAQYRLVKLLADKRRQITVVGDPDQSIYAWRGADIRNILNFEKDYPDCGIIRMEQNYRSTPVILEAANEIIKHNTMRKPKALWTEKEGGALITLYEACDEKDEAEQVIRRILEFKNQGISLADQVIFYRVHAQSRILEDVLRRANLPYKIIGGVRFYDRKEIKDVIAYLRAILYPHDDLSLKRILNVPSRGIGKKAFEMLEKFSAEGQISFQEAVHQSDRVTGLPPKSQKAIQSFAKMLSRLRKEKKDLSVDEILREVLERSGYLHALEEERTIEAQSRLENIEEFFSVIEDWKDANANDSEKLTLEAFLESISLMTDLDTWDHGTNILTLMTLHTAKGLEFPNVFMVGLEEGLFPNGNAYTDDLEDLEEERRLCYVGLTRAKERLFLSYARERRLYGARHYNLPSRFLNEIPSELYGKKSTLHVSESREETFPDSEIEIDFDIGFKKHRILFE
ncbi:MAG: UvrD-helicase domain-containing protein [Candidatus Omnitrophica bacterium]|nr:UvrD-helicase domain-containing protein [Candidatus Omnitrophota bacterium]